MYAPLFHPRPLARPSFFLSLPVCRRSSLLAVEEPNHTTARKPVPINHSILSDNNYRIVYAQIHSSVVSAEMIWASLPQRVLKWFQHKESSVSVYMNLRTFKIIKVVTDSPFLTVVARSNSD